jgi:hypothetical protein
MEDYRLVKMIFHGEAARGSRKIGRPHKSWRECVKDDIKTFELSIEDLHTSEARWSELLESHFQKTENKIKQQFSEKRNEKHSRQGPLIL